MENDLKEVIDTDMIEKSQLELEIKIQLTSLANPIKLLIYLTLVLFRWTLQSGPKGGRLKPLRFMLTLNLTYEAVHERQAAGRR